MRRVGIFETAGFGKSPRRSRILYTYPSFVVARLPLMKLSLTTLRGKYGTWRLLEPAPNPDTQRKARNAVQDPFCNELPLWLRPSANVDGGD